MGEEYNKYEIIEHAKYEMEGCWVIIPKVNGVPDFSTALFLEDVSLEIWRGLENRRTDKEIIRTLSSIYMEDEKEIEKDFYEFIDELAERNYIVYGEK